jgi:glycosyltransferase involved in cell wall biosynthesis
MRIGVLTGSFHPDPGGPSTYLRGLLPELIARGHSVELITYGQPTPDDAHYGYPVTRVAGRRLRKSWDFLRRAWALAARSDVLFVHTTAVLLLPLIRPRYRGRIVTKVVSDWAWEMADRRGWTALGVEAFQTGPTSRKVEIAKAFHRRAVRMADTVIVPSRHVARLAEGWGVDPSRIHIVYNAIPDPALADIPRENLRRELSLPSGRLLVSVARLTPVKGVDVAVKALHQLPDAHLIVIGDGPERAALDAAAPKGRVTFTGQLPHEDVLRYLRAADIYVLSSRTEGLSHTLLEALAVGTPSVASRVGGNPEVVTDGVDGLLVPPDDPAALADAIRRLDDLLYHAQIAVAALERSLAFRWDNEVTQTAAILTTQP